MRHRAALVLIAACILASGFYFARKSGANPEAYGNDFNVYYFAASEVIAGRDPYQRSLGEWTPYLYPPLLAELIVPLALLPLPAAAYFWFLINAGSVLAAGWMSASLAVDRDEKDSRLSGRKMANAALAVLAVIFVTRFVLDNFSLGQVNTVVVALAVAHVYLYSRDRRALSALALALAISIKLTPALLLAYHLARLRVKFTLACAALVVAITLVSLLPLGTAGPSALGTFFHRTINNEQGYDLADAGNQSVRGWLERLAPRADTQTDVDEASARKPVSFAILLTSAMLLAIAIFFTARSRGELAGAAPFFCCAVLLSPLSWKAHFVMLIPAIACVLAATMRFSGTRRALIVAMSGAAFALFNLTSPRIIGLAAAEWSDAHSLVCAGAVLIFVASGRTAKNAKVTKGT